MEMPGKYRAISFCQKTCGRWTEPEELWEIYFSGFLILILFTGIDLRIIRCLKLEPKPNFFKIKHRISAT